ncbi:ABC transporter permease [Polymorphum gilvum]|uniref:Export ABC transporter permease protein n=1 Tax=Polymorphum gilvum (strain LMG 25793 / CGMCC 1.9160 / SL003B-26A1) TaxID=991905 RepID=F2J3C4_POLGS|nr:ABC transporter permease [Polymorphum gilvum]ADZ69931.1 Export ABC transporter permease protein [Polymorphum gilvum SL003B-26A1]
MWWETIKLAFQAIRRNALRSTLTVLGIVIGVAAVIGMVSIGHSTTAQVTASLARLGSNLLVVRPGVAERGPGGVRTDAKAFDRFDVEVLRAQLYSVRAVAPTVSTSATAVVGNENRTVSVWGTDNAYFVTQDWPVVRGREFLDSDLRAGRPVCIVGQTIKEELFQNQDPIGKRMRVRGLSCEVVGLLEEKGQTGFGQDQDNTVIMPLRAVQRRLLGSTDIAMISVSARDGVDTGKVQADIEAILRERRNITPGKDDDFHVRDMKQIVATMTSTTTVLTGLLGAVAAVSLLVGGIGIMNIMLVSVTERTREIGIRLAIGALERQVLLQFLVEAVVLSLFGGVLGILAGIALAAGAVTVMQMPFVLDPSIIAVAFVFSALVGVVFGYFPARQAARLDPIEALRHE